MSWKGVAAIEKQLSDALGAFNWSGAEEVCIALIERINNEPDPLPEAAAKRLLQRLRRKRRFRLMMLVAESLIRSGQHAAQIRRQYAQALIDQGALYAAESVLRSIIQEPQTAISEQREARGLIGRIYKQLYVNIKNSGERNRSNLQRAVNEYLDVYSSQPQENLWHGINVVALLDRARRDGLNLQGMPDPCVIAGGILRALEEKEAAGDQMYAFDVATALEALVALAQCDDSKNWCEEAEEKALEYAACEDADAFEIASTLRQLDEVWQLSDSTPACSRLLPILRAALLSKEGGALTVEPESVKGEIARTESARDNLEKVFGADKTRTLSWYMKGLERCKSIARVERLDGKGHGTGWLINAEDFFEGRTGKLLLTNAHVVSLTYDRALTPKQAKANFQVLGKVVDVDDIVWSSPVGELDATFLSLKGDPPPADALPVEPTPMKMNEPPPRMYIIGHPGGRDLELSLNDNLLLACNERLLHYRTPTEGGSSGSPVFEPLDWRVVALHHAGKNSMERIDGKPGTYEANEGISICALMHATKHS